MQYVGSKRQLAKHLLPTMLAERNPGQWWVEPFVGGGNMIDQVPGLLRLGNDSNEFIIALLQAVRDGYVPPSYISKEEYHAIRANPHNYPKKLVGFAATACSFGGKWFSSYAFNNKGTNYTLRGANVLMKQAKNLRGVVLRCGDYRDLYIPPNSLIYCDPPYDTVTKAYSTKRFDHPAFWDWCKQKAKEGHTVFISEYSAPSDFECVLEIQHKTLLDKNKEYAKIERLYKS